MDLSLSEEFDLFSQELQRFLSPIVLQKIAKQVGFVQRSSKYQAGELMALCVWLSQEVASTSLYATMQSVRGFDGCTHEPRGTESTFQFISCRLPSKNLYLAPYTETLCDTITLFGSDFYI